MSAFKDQVGRDISQVFLNADEFSDIHIVDGKEMTVQVDENEALERQLRATAGLSGVYKKQKVIYVSEAEFGALPYIGRALNFDGRTYIVTDAVSEAGIHSITIEANRS